MNKYIIGSAIFVLIALVIVITLGSLGVSIYNTQVSLKNTYEAKVSANQAIFDNTYKKITQASQVTKANKDALKEIFNGYASARNTSNNSSLIASFLQESVPNADLSIYKNLTNIIVGARDEWTGNQVALIDISREYNKNLDTFPSNIILKFLGFERIKPIVITSGVTQEVFLSGEENNTKLEL